MLSPALLSSDSEVEEIAGHGPLQPFFDDDSVTEIMANGPFEIWIERAGRLALTGAAFATEECLRRYARRLLSSHGRKVDQRAPFADAVIEGGIRLHVAVAPVSRRGICLSIRKPPKAAWSLGAVEEAGAFSPGTSAILRELVQARKNIFICGGTGSGKTSLLSALLAEANPSERILALEDVAELRVSHPHFLSLEARPPNQEGEGELPLPRLLREALRMRPDRLVMGECRGPEALDLLMALNTGHPGSMGTIHSNSPRDALHRLELLALLAADNLRESALRSLIASCIQVVVHVERAPGGRRISSIAELKGADGGNFLLRETKFA